MLTARPSPPLPEEPHQDGPQAADEGQRDHITADPGQSAAKRENLSEKEGGPDLTYPPGIYLKNDAHDPSMLGQTEPISSVPADSVAKQSDPVIRVHPLGRSMSIRIGLEPCGSCVLVSGISSTIDEFATRVMS